MLHYMQGCQMQTLDIDDYTIQNEWDGSQKKLTLSLPVDHPQQLGLAERSQLYESTEGQVYRISKYDRGKSTLDLEAELDLDSLCAGALIGWDNRADADGTQWMPLGATVTAILKDTGWTVDDQSGRVDVQQMESFNGTPLEAITQALEVWGNDLGVQYDNAKKVVHLVSPGQRQPTGAYLTEDLNLLEAPQVRGKAPRGEYYNRLYLIGADGLLLPGSHYVEYRASSEPIVSHVESNEDITDSAVLYSTAMEMVQKAAAISRSYTCKVADLYKLQTTVHTGAPTDVKLNLKLALYDTIILIDRADYSRSYQEISRTKIHPEHPEKNEITLATVPGTLSATAGRTYSVARDAAARAYNAKKAAQQAGQAADDASKVATDYIHDSGSSLTFGRPGSGVSVGMTNSGLQFSGIRNRTPLWTNTNSKSMAANTRISLNLSSYAAIAIGFVDNLGGIADTGVDGVTVQFTTAMVNGVEQRATYTWDYPRVRTFTPTSTGITFGAGGYLDSTKVGGIPVGANLHKNASCCVPAVIYGFM